MPFNRILVLSPHTDDGELGAGGTIAKMVDEGKTIYYVAFSGCETSVPNGLPKNTLRKECTDSSRVMGLLDQNVRILNYEVRKFPEFRQEILEDLVKIKAEVHPDLVLVPSSCDLHQDHQTIYWEAVRAFKKESSIWGYEHPWNNLGFDTDLFVKLSSSDLAKKCEILRQYKSQQDRGYMNEERIKALVVTRGAQIDTRYAEAFEIIREIYE